MSYSRWTSSEQWNKWDGEFRVVNSQVKLSYNDLDISESSAVKARYKMGQYDSVSDDTARLNRETIELDPSEQIKYQLQHATNVPTKSEITESGLWSPIRNSYAQLPDDGDDLVLYPQSGKNFYAGCWFKAYLLDYSGGVGYIIAHRDDGTGGKAYAIYVDTDNKVKAVIRKSGGLITLSSELEIDDKWHYALIVSSAPGSAQNHYLVIDNIVADVVSDTSEISGTSLGFTVGSIEIGSGFNGFAGHIDEVVIGEWTGTFNPDLLSNSRFSSQIITSPVVDSENDGSSISRITTTYDAPNGSSVTFSFRASDTESDLAYKDWSGFTSPQQIESETETDASILSANQKGRYHQIRALLLPSTESTDTSSIFQTSAVGDGSGSSVMGTTPSLDSLEIFFNTPAYELNMAHTTYLPGQLIGQQVEFSGSKRFDKIALDLLITATERISYITGYSDAISFQSANFTHITSPVSFQPTDPEADTSADSWQSNGLPVGNTAQPSDFGDPDDAVLSAPSISYDMYITGSGMYDLWCYGTGRFYWGWNNDTTHLRKASVGNGSGIPYWTKFGNASFNAGEVHTFQVYLADGITSRDGVIFDQWYFTTNTQLDTLLSSYTGYQTPLPLSVAPFNTAVTLISRELSGSEPNSITLWKNSSEMWESGIYNYEIPESNSEFVDGINIEYRQVGGGSGFNAAWKYIDVTSGVGSTYTRQGYGEPVEWT